MLRILTRNGNTGVWKLEWQCSEQFKYSVNTESLIDPKPHYDLRTQIANFEVKVFSYCNIFLLIPRKLNILSTQKYPDIVNRGKTSTESINIFNFLNLCSIVSVFLLL